MLCRVRLNPTIVEAVAGAIGEVAQIAILYPLDTIKVRPALQASSARLCAGRVGMRERAVQRASEDCVAGPLLAWVLVMLCAWGWSPDGSVCAGAT